MKIGVCKVDDCNNTKLIAFDLCSKHYTRLRRYGDVEYPGKKGGGKPRLIDFKVSDSGCFEVTSHIDRAGYPEIMIKGKVKKIHRHIFEECFGEIGEGLVIRHKCDNPFCINPEHLEPGTIADNMRDMIERGRQAKGSKKALSKLKEIDIPIIRRMSASGMTNREISKIFKVHDSVISQVKNRKIWKHVKEED